MNRKQVKLYNLIMPIWLLFILPFMWLIIIPANFIVDVTVLAVAMKILKVTDVWKNLKKSFWKTWLLGFAADFIACIPMMILSQIPTENYDGLLGRLQYGIMINQFDNVGSFLCVLFCVVLAGALVFYFNYTIALKKTDLSKSQKRNVAMIMAIATAPYLFFVPTPLLY